MTMQRITDIISIIIGTANNPPSIPTIKDTTSGNRETTYFYTTMSTNADNDTISYTFNWGDDTTNSSRFLPNGTIYKAIHKWISAGIYTVNVIATDNKTTSKKVIVVASYRRIEICQFYNLLTARSFDLDSTLYNPQSLGPKHASYLQNHTLRVF